MDYYKTVVKPKQLDYVNALFDDVDFNLDEVTADVCVRTKTYYNTAMPDYDTLQFSELSHINRIRMYVAEMNVLVEQFLQEHNPEEMYNEFKIPKRTGGFRTIDAPNEELKEVQYKVLAILKKMKVLHHDSAWAYIKGRSVVGALKEHQENKSRWFLKLDLKDFFGSCDKELFQIIFEQLYPFCYLTRTIFNRFINNLFAIASKDGKLPQGTPLSPYLTNLIMVPNDFLINRLLNLLGNGDYLPKQRYVYTRYADDILISAKESFNHDALVEDIKRLLSETTPSLHIKDEKTRYGSSNGRNWNLGIMYNKDRELTIGTKKKKYLKQAIHNCIVNEFDIDVTDAQVLVGQLSWLRNVEPEYFKGLMDYYKAKNEIDVWESLLDIIRA